MSTVLEKLYARIARDDGRLKLTEGGATVNRIIGRLLSRTTRDSRLYEINYDPKSKELDWHRKESEWENSRDLHGCYPLRSTIELGDQQLWKLYITLVRVEDAFRSMKSDLGLHPFHHQLAQRCRAHIWITVLAYHLLRWTEHSLKLSGYESTWRTLRRQLDTQWVHTLVFIASSSSYPDSVFRTLTAGYRIKGSKEEGEFIIKRVHLSPSWRTIYESTVADE